MIQCIWEDVCSLYENTVMCHIRIHMMDHCIYDGGPIHYYGFEFPLRSGRIYSGRIFFLCWEKYLGLGKRFPFTQSTLIFNAQITFQSVRHSPVSHLGGCSHRAAYSEGAAVKALCGSVEQTCSCTLEIFQVIWM